MKPEHDHNADCPPESSKEPPHSIFSRWQRITYVHVASLAAFASPVSSSIYLPAMLSIAKDLDVSLTKISWTITVFLVHPRVTHVSNNSDLLQVFQGLAPTIIGGFSDRVGRRPAYIICFTLFIASSIGLALQTNYVALLILRCVQSCGSSGTAVLSSAVVSDIATRQQRGSYIGLAALGSSLGPVLGPLIGGLLDHFLGWRSIFWFLAIFGGVMLLVYMCVMPETCRNVVGNGSIAPQNWNKPLISYLRRGNATSTAAVADLETPAKQRPGLFASIPIIFERESFLLLYFGGLVYAGSYMISVGLPQQLSSTYNYDSLQVSLCYIPIGLGSIIIRPVIGRLIDANYYRHARQLGVKLVKNQQQDIDGFPIEWARLQIALPLMYLAGAAIFSYSWVIEMPHPPLAVILVLLFLCGSLLAATFQVVTTLIIDVNPRSPAAASAAFQLVRCLLGAGGVALVTPLLNSLGSGWTGTYIVWIWIVLSLCWWSVVIWGPKWRVARQAEKSVV
jgi:multidrug resistance protein